MWKTNVEAAPVLWYNKPLVQHDVKQYCSRNVGGEWVFFFLTNWGKKIWSLLGRCNHHNSCKFLAPICQSLLLNEVLYPVTKEFSPDFFCLAQSFC
jgi:hypothetical protein